LATIAQNPTLSAADQSLQRLRAATGVRRVSGYCDIDGCQVAWEESSNQKSRNLPVLFLHSAGSGSREFRPVLDRCPPGSRLIFLDWPGHGRSSELAGEDGGSDSKPNFTVEFAAGIVRRLMDQLRISRAILVGSGFGAAVAIRLATDFPEYVQGLVLCQPAGLIAPQSAGPYASRGRKGLYTLLRRIRKFTPGKPDSRGKLAAVRQAMRLEALRKSMLPIRSSAARSLRLSEPGLRKAIDTLPCPALFALSHDDLEYPVSKYLALLDPSLAFAPQHQFTIFAGPFSPIWDEPDRFSLALSSFIQAQMSVLFHTHAWLLAAVDYPSDGNNLWKCVHPDCGVERVLSVNLDANRIPFSE
jgi:pimeloyl-ACP methyl ester carboxylesterase